MQTSYHASDLLLKQVDTLPRSLTCSLCMEIYVNPTTTWCCNEVYCKQCILNWMARSDICPHCNTSNVQVNPNPVRRIMEAIGSLEVHCPYAQKGCSYTFAYNDLESHLKSCSFAIVPCPFACIRCAQPHHARQGIYEHLIQSDAEHMRLLQKFLDDHNRQLSELKEQLKRKQEELQQMQEQLAEAQTPTDPIARLPRGERSSLFNRKGENNWCGLATYQPGLLRTRAQNASSVHPVYN